MVNPVAVPDGAANARTRVMTRTVQAARRAERLSETHLRVRWAIVRALRSNRGAVQIGDASVTAGDPGISPGGALGVRGDPMVDLYDVFMVSGLAGNGAEVTYAA